MTMNGSSTEEEDIVWYFAIGSMCNPISITNRELHAIESFPAEVMDHELHFFGSSGVAGAVAKEGKSFHGVLHKMTKDDKIKLDKIEMGYDADPCKCKLYDGSEQDAVIYVMNREKLKNFGKTEDKPPTERYITIIIEGCEHYGVKKEYVDWLKSLEFQKRKVPSEFEKFVIPEGTPTMTDTDVEVGDGKDDNPLYTTCNGKVLKHEGFPDMMLEKILSNKARGIHSFEVWLNAMLYDPTFGIIKSPEDVSKLCAASTEDQIVGWSNLPQSKMKTTVVGLIDLTYKD
jgi:hypothetical protein